MKKFIPALISVLAIGLTGCTTLETEETTKETVVETPEVLTIADQIEDFDGYTVLAEDEKPHLGCGDSDSMTTVQEGEISQLLLGEGEYPIALYLTPNYEGWTTEDLEEVNSCIDGVGTKGALMAYDDYILWGYPNCSAGWAPDTDDPTYDDFQSCMAVEAEVDAYLE